MTTVPAAGGGPARPEQGVRGAAEVAGEAGCWHRRTRPAPSPSPGCDPPAQRSPSRPAEESKGSSNGSGHELRDGAFGVVRRVQGERRVVPGPAPRRPRGGRPPPADGHCRAGRWRRVARCRAWPTPAPVALAYQRREISAVVEVCVRHHHVVEGSPGASAGSSQFSRRRRCVPPGSRPQSTSRRDEPSSTRNLLPVTVPVAPRNERWWSRRPPGMSAHRLSTAPDLATDGGATRLQPGDRYAGR